MAQSPQAQQSAASTQTILLAAKGGGITFAGKLISYATMFVSGIVLARFLGAEQYGLYSLAGTALVLMTGIAMLGLNTATLRYVPMYQSQKKDDLLAGTLLIGLTVPLLVAILVGFVIFLFADPLSARIFHEPGLAPILRVAAIGIPFHTLSMGARKATQAFKAMRYGVIAQDIVMNLSKLALVVGIALMVGLSAVQAMAAYIVSIAVAAGLLMYFLNKLIPLTVIVRSARFNVKEMFVFSLPVYASQLLSTFSINIQTLLLGALGTAASVGIFTVASRVSMVGDMFRVSIVLMAMPIVSELHSQGKRAQLGHFYQTMTKWIFIVNLPVFLVTVLFAKPILSIFGQDFAGGTWVLIILSGGILINAATGICGVMIVMTGYTWLTTLNSILALGITIVLNLILVPEMGEVGAAIAGVVAMSILNIVRVIETFGLLRLQPYNITFLKPLAAGLLALGGTWFLTIGVLSRLDIVWEAVIGILFLGSVYMIGIVLLGLSDEDRIVLSRVFGRLHRLLPALIPFNSGDSS